jgi:hypothetical protein
MQSRHKRYPWGFDESCPVLSTSVMKTESVVNWRRQVLVTWVCRSGSSLQRSDFLYPLVGPSLVRFVSTEDSFLMKFGSQFISPQEQGVVYRSSCVPDPMVDSWLLMSSPMPVLLILVFYLYFVLKLGPQLMATREAFNLQRVLVAYNFYQVVFSLWLSTMVRITGLQFARMCTDSLKVKVKLRRLSHSLCVLVSPSLTRSRVCRSPTLQAK